MRKGFTQRLQITPLLTSVNIVNHGIITRLSVLSTFELWITRFRRCICTYMYSVRDWAMDLGHTDPVNVSGNQKFQFQKLLAGVKRARTSKRKVKKPLTKSHLRKILQHLKNTNLFDRQTKVMFKAALLLVFFGFLHCSE